MKVLVLGASGMAGHVVSQYLIEKGYDVSTQARSHKLNKKTHLVDVNDVVALDKLLTQNNFDAVINCIGLLVKACDEHKDQAVYINSFLPHRLEEVFEGFDTQVIHISSDGVFSGNTGPYDEYSPHDGQSFYGRTKSLGELDNQKDMTIRTSIIGPDTRADGISLFNWIMQADGEVSGFDNVVWNGVTTLELAKAIDATIKQGLSGVINLSPKTPITKYALLGLIKEVFDLDDVSIKAKSGKASNYTLNSTRQDLAHRPPEYPVMIKDLRNWMDKYPEIYKHYAIKEN